MAAGSGGETDFHRGRRLGKYEILTRLSVGGMAELFLAFTSGPGGFRKYVALKQILPDVAKDKQFVQMFLDEARITAAFSHANVGQVFDLGEADRELFLAMEFISGQNLQQIIKVSKKRKSPLPAGFCARVIRDTCLGLHYAHSFVDATGKPAPVVHRDVSPKNVMVTYTGEVKVIDFGIAKAKNRLGRTSVGMVKGTVGYMSPEQIRGSALDGRSDLFCAGTMLYELLVGERLYGNDGASAMVRIVEEDAPSVRDAVPEISEALAAVVARSLARNRDERFSSGKEMAKAIEAAVGAELFDEEEMAGILRGMFQEEMEKTRSLVENAPAAESTAPAPEAAAAAPVRRLPTGRSGLKPRTPSPNEGVTAPQQPRPPVEEVNTTVPRRPTASRPRPSAARRAEPAEEAVASTEVRSNLRKGGGRSRAGSGARPIVRSDTDRQAAPAADAQPKAPFRLPTGWIALVLLIAGLGFAHTRIEGGLGAWLSPQLARATAYVKSELEPTPPPDTTMKALPESALAVMRAREAREATLREKLEAEAYERARAEAEAEAARQAAEEAAEAAAAAKLEARARTTRRESPARVKRAPPAPPTTVKQEAPVVEVLDTRTSASAAKAGIGWLSLFTVPPAAIYDGATLLGTAPLTKVPLPWGTYKLTVLDPDGGRRVLSVPIEKGKITKLAVRVGELPKE